MSGREVVEQWLFEYSCRHGLSRAMAEIAFNHSHVWSIENCSIPSIYVLLPYMTEVLNEQLVSQYDMVIRELTRLYDISGDIVPFKIYARLLVALKVMVLFEMLKNDDKLVLPRLNGYFPRTGFHHKKADDDFNEKLSEGQKNFRAVFLRLIADKKQRREYLKTQLKVDYGVEFEDRMKDLLRRVIHAIDRSLPPCAIDRILGKNADQRLVDELSAACSPSFEMLLDAVNDKDSLTESQVIDLLRNMSPDMSTSAPTCVHPFIRDLTGIIEESENHDAPDTLPWLLKKERTQIVKRACHSNSPAAKRQRVSDVDIFCSNTVSLSRSSEAIRYVEGSSSVDRDASEHGNTISQVDTVSSSVEDTDLEVENIARVFSEAQCSDVSKQSVTLRDPGTEKSFSVASNSRLSSEESFVSDSDLQSRLEAPLAHLIPSSYSFDQYNMSPGADESWYVRIPPIHKHRRVDVVGKSCVIELVHNKELDQCRKDGTGLVKIYS